MVSERFLAESLLVPQLSHALAQGQKYLLHLESLRSMLAAVYRQVADRQVVK